MSIDFATLQGLTIPEGVVKSILITEADGTAYEVGFAKPLVTVTVGENSCDVSDSNNYSFGSFDVPDEISSVGNYELPIGTEFTFSLYANSGKSVAIYLNGEEVASASDNSTADYTYTLTGNITVRYTATPFSGYIYITEE